MTDDRAAQLDGEEDGVLAESIVDTIRHPLLILNPDLRVRSANLAFYQAFQADPAATRGRMIYDLGNQQWDIPRLRELLSEVLPERETVEGYEITHAFERIGERVMLLNARKLPRVGDRPPLILVAIEDLTEQRRSQSQLEHQKELAEKIVGTVREPLLVLHDDLRIKSANHAFYETFNADPAETEDRLIYEIGERQWDIPELRRLLFEVLPDNEFFEDFEVEHTFPAIGRRVMLLNARRVDHLQLILLAIEDITERRRAEQDRELLVDELNHRVKNLFAVIRALASQGNGVRSVQVYREVLLGRMDALAQTHDLLFESQWRGADLRSLAGTLRAFTGERGEAIALDGGPVELDARQALSVSLVLHELATNATKYGALSTPHGRVLISWRTENDDGGARLHLQWQEQGGPPVTEPQNGGFGTQLIRRAFAYELGGTAELAFDPAGLCLEATIPLA